MSEIRSVSVHLDADVAGYIAKMRLAGAETDKAFGRANTQLSTTNTTLGKVEGSATKAERALGKLDGNANRSNGFTKLTRNVDGFLGKLGLIPTLALPATAALIPLAASALAVGAAFAAPLAFVGGGVTLFAILGGLAVKDTNKQLKQIDTLKKSVDSAKLSLDAARRSAGANASTSASVTNAQIRLNRATKAYKTALGDLSPAQQKYSSALDHIHSSFDKFMSGPSGDKLLGPISQAINLGADLLPKIEPVISAVSGGLGTLLTDLDKFTKTNGFTFFVSEVSHQIGPDLVSIGHTLGSFTRGLGELLVVTGKKLSPDLLHWLGHLSSDFADFAKSKRARQDVQDFVDYFHKVGPQVADTVGAVARALGHMVKALAPLGPPVLKVVQGIANAIAGIPVPVLTALAGAAIGLTAFQKLGGFKAVGLLGKLGSLGGATGGLAGRAASIVGVQKVFVVNMPPGGFGGGPGGSPNPFPGTPLAAPAAAEVGLGASVAGVALLAAPFVAAMLIENAKRPPIGPQFAKDPSIGRGGRASIQWAAAHGDPNAIAWLQADSAPPPTPLQTHRQGLPTGGRAGGVPLADVHEAAKAAKEAATPFDALIAREAKASHGMDLIGGAAAQALPGAAKHAQNLGDKVNAITGTKASQQMDLIGNSAHSNLVGAGRDVDGLKSKLDSLPAKKYIQIDAKAAAALHELDLVAAKLAGIHSKTVTVSVQHGTGGTLKGLGGADGGTIPGPRHPYGDKVLIHAAPGEEIISNRHGQADAFRRDQAMGRIPRYADGGTVGSGSSGSGAYMTDFSGSLATVTTRLQMLRNELKDSTDQLSQERQARQALAQQRQSVISTARDSMRSQILGVTPDASIWGSGATTNPLDILRGNIKNARQFKSTISQLRRRGLSGAVVGQITDLADAQQVAGMSDHQLKELQRLYARRQRVTQAAGVSAGNLAYGQQIREQTKAIHGTNQRIDQLKKEIAGLRKDGPKNAQATGDAVGSRINHSVATAARRR